METVIAGGLASGVALGVASLMKGLSGSGKDAEIVIERTQFASSLGVFFNSANGCSSMRTGDLVTEAEQEYEIKGWVTPDGKSKSYTFDGFSVFKKGESLRHNYIKFLRSKKVLAAEPSIIISEGGSSKELKKATITFSLSVSKKPNVRDPVELAAEAEKLTGTLYEYRVPVMVNVATNAIELCGTNTTMAESCYALKGVFDLQSGKCELAESCEYFGTYTDVTCAPMFGGVVCGTKPDGTVVSTSVNSVTGQMSCPAGSTAVSTGVEVWSQTINCGKKCEANVNHSVGYYSCLKC